MDMTAPAEGVPGRRRLARGARAAAALLAMAPLLGGCQFSVMDPMGPIGASEKSLILFATGLMLLIVVPVIVMTLAFAWRFRASNTAAVYKPDWEHSTKIEVVVWLVPCLLIIVLAAVTWSSTHRLDPYRPIASANKPIEVDVVSLDWKWLFIYPDLHIASVNELALPVGTPVNFRITSAGVMNSFFIPQLGGQIYSMAGMQTRLSLLASKPGNYAGISANYSGDGFSDMDFTARAMSSSDFTAWVGTVRASKNALTVAALPAACAAQREGARRLLQRRSATLFHDVLNECVDGATCMDAAMRGKMTKAASGAMPGMGSMASTAPAKKSEGM